MNTHANLVFAEKSLTLVVALFSDSRKAENVADDLRRIRSARSNAETVDLIKPGDVHWRRKMEPEEPAIRRTAWRSHGTLMAAGLVVGLLISWALISQWPAAKSSPLLTVVAVSVFATFAGGLLAGLLTLRPDRSAVALQVHAGLKDGRYAVVVHPRDEASASSAGEALRNAGGEVLRSI